jgi:anti-anti-sigma factor
MGRRCATHLRQTRLIALEATVTPIIAPPRLTTEHRLDFRRIVLDGLDSASNGGDQAVEVDLSAAVELDASGLGVLILLQKRARERGLRTRLLNVPSTVERLLDATRLEPLFEVVRF